MGLKGARNSASFERNGASHLVCEYGYLSYLERRSVAHRPHSSFPGLFVSIQTFVQIDYKQFSLLPRDRPRHTCQLMTLECRIIHGAGTSWPEPVSVDVDPVGYVCQKMSGILPPHCGKQRKPMSTRNAFM
jgi:hypothetical protein